ncbi:hypothetical protein BJX76DRAFT_355568 [Aspergillus varians]
MFSFNFTRSSSATPDQKSPFLSHLTFTRWPSSNTPTPKKNRTWIKGVTICTWILTTVLTLNILLTATATGIAYSKSDSNTKTISFAPLHTGTCSAAKHWTTGLHLVINILSTVLLGASNYCLQCLASPSRDQVDEAHGKRVWVRIGMPNVWDLLVRQRGRRAVLGWILVGTSVPVHLIYNSAIFFSFGPTKYAVVVAQGPVGPVGGNNMSSDFETCFERVVGMDMDAFDADVGRGDLEMLSNEECIDTFAQDYVSGQRMVVLVTDEAMPESEPVVFMGSGNSVAGGFNSKGSSTFDWMCGGDYQCTKDRAREMVDGEDWEIQPLRWSIPSVRLQVPTDTENGFDNISGALYVGAGSEVPDTPDTRRLSEILQGYPDEDEVQAELDDASNWEDASFPGNVTVYGHTPMCGIRQHVPFKLPRTYPVQHCLTVPVEETCQLVFSPVIALIVIACNVVKLICTIVTARDGREDVFLTTGDAIASFLARPDPTTEGSCLLSKPLVDTGIQGWRKKPQKGKKRAALDTQINRTLPLQLSPRKRWLQAVSTGRWIFTITLFICILIPAIILLRLGIIDYNGAYGSQSIWASGLGEVTSATILIGMNTPASADGIFSMILLANTPQLLITFTYFTLNALLTIMLGAVEYNNYGLQRKPLRVSWPRGAQRSTYYLSLPYRYSFPLLIASAVLHWLVSQSFFFVQIVPFDIDGVPEAGKEVVTCGYSPVAIIFATVVGVSLLVGSMLLGLRRFKSDMPLGAQCSAVVSAACHPKIVSGDDENHALGLWKWK